VVALYAGARRLALELSANDFVARIDRHRAAYPYEAGYHRGGGDWRMDLSRPAERCEGPPAGGWRMRIAQMGAFVLALLPRRQERQQMSREEGCGVKEGRVEELARMGQQALESQPFSVLIGVRLASFSEGRRCSRCPSGASSCSRTGSFTVA
jgi:hypothetical protein